jgi:hypothetical protein
MSEPIDIAELVFWAYREPGAGQTVDASADAALVGMAIDKLPDPHRRLIEHFGRAGHPPPWTVGSGKIVSLARVRSARLAYREWLRALVVLRCNLAGELSAFRVTGPDAPPEPWRRSA